ncbi:DNA methylase [Halanaerobium congolense]|uniref:DNA methylase n=1 Tax=Halanaerobium congolense TaxID=54121 RepID=A0A4R8GGK8_9FIRM|nr:DNA methyltransferase [Halanaerobium congolense]TDX39614.1 DNA methylase [Halanaerobium congolense]
MNKEDITPLEKLLDGARDIDGFPIADDKDILKLSDPPYYTACPNPYINDFIEEYGTTYDPENDDYERKPFVGDVSEGKNDSIYRAYSYHTQVPHKAIQKYIKHYTKENDIVFDGFAGTGMTGVAAQKTQRNALLVELSPYANLISSSCNNKKLNKAELKTITKKIIDELKNECTELYYTEHKENNELGVIDYVVWSDVYECPYCNTEYILWDESVKNNGEKRENQKKYKCSSCGAEISKKESKRIFHELYDTALGKNVSIARQEPVLIFYSYKNTRYEKIPDEKDINKLKKIRSKEIPYWYPNNKLPDGYNTSQPIKSHGFTHVHHFFTKRNIWVLSKFLSLTDKYSKRKSIRNFLLNALLASLPRASKRNRYIPKYGNRHVGTLSGTLYCPYFFEENNLIDALERRINKMIKGTLKENNKNVFISNQSITNLNLEEDSIDYIFTDPPFGANIMYSELNFLMESWMKVFTNKTDEAIINNKQKKDLNDYTSLMTKSFQEMYRILKPNRWITIEFHNSKASIWNGIQESLNRAGFIIAQVATLDKKKGTIKQLSSPGAVKNDLVINAYKPKKEFEDKFLKNAGEGLEADFVKEQLKHLPVEANIERTEQMLYSKMLAHYVENGFKIKYDANNFYKLLHDNFVELDGYWFLEDQADEYSEWKSSLKLDEIEDIKKGNQVLFVVDEKSALTWINNFLDEPKEYGEIYTSYEQIATQTDDKIPELRELLDQNFILEDGKYRRPKTRKERESIEKSRTKNLERAWKKLLDRAKNGSRKIKNIRKEALIHGFTKCYQQENYEDIVTVADRLYKSTLESSGDILDFVDIARMKTE